MSGPLLDLFRSRNYRLYFTGQFVSQTGNWMTQTALLWLVYQLTNSAFLTGLLGFAAQIPVLLLSPFAGVWVDRLDRVRVLTLTRLAAFSYSLSLAALTWTEAATFPLLLALASVHGVIQAFDLPGRQALNRMLAEKSEHLPRIISLNSTLINLGRMVGPTLAGFILISLGAGFCFLLDALSYLIALATLFALRLPPRPSTLGLHKTSLREDFREGLRIAFLDPPIRLLLCITALVSVFYLSVFTLLPAYAKEIFAGEGQVLGLLMSSFSTGGVLAGVLLARRRQNNDLERVIFRGLLLGSGSLIAFSLSRSLSLSVLCLFLLGAGSVLVAAASNTLVQARVEEGKHGRVMSIYGISFQGGMPLGALITGWLAQLLGLSWAALVNGGAALTLAVLFLSRLPRVGHAFLASPLHPEDDIIPEGASTHSVTRSPHPSL